MPEFEHKVVVVTGAEAASVRVSRTRSRPRARMSLSLDIKMPDTEPSFGDSTIKMRPRPKDVFIVLSPKDDTTLDSSGGVPR